MAKKHPTKKAKSKSMPITLAPVVAPSADAVAPLTTPTEAAAPVAKRATPEATRALSHEEIARRAYELWLARGAGFGDPSADWLEAESELRATCAA